MLKVNVGLSRKISRDYNSSGFSLNLEGELCAGPEDPEAMIEKIKEFYDLAEEALNQQIERYEGESAIADRDMEPPARQNGRHLASRPRQGQPRQGSGGNNNGPSGNGEPATNKQIQYLLNLGKRHGLTPVQLEGRIESLLGERIGVYDLTKSEAGTVIEALSQNGAAASNGSGRGRTSR